MILPGLGAVMVSSKAPGFAPGVASAGTGGGANVTASTCGVPSGTVAGDLLLMHGMIASGAGPVDIHVPAGWTPIFEANDNSSASRWFSSFFAYRIATGSEGATIPLSIDGGVQGEILACALRVTGRNGNVFGANYSLIGGGATTFDPPPVTTAWLADDNSLFVVGVASTGNTMPNTPAGYGLMTTYTPHAFRGRVSMFARNAPGGTEDPPATAFNTGQTSASVATFAVRGF